MSIINKKGMVANHSLYIERFTCITGESLGWAHTQHFNFRHTHKTKKKLKKNKIIVYQLM